VTRAWYGTDLQGSVRYTTDDGGNVGDGSAGNVGGPAGYDPYGVPEGTSAPAPFGYTGELQDPNTGLVNLRARTYNPLVGQFLTRDPLEQQTGQAYAYAGGDPVNNADPSGRSQCAFRAGYLQLSLSGPCTDQRTNNALINATTASAHHPMATATPGVTPNPTRTPVPTTPPSPTVTATPTRTSRTLPTSAKQELACLQHQLGNFHGTTLFLIAPAQDVQAQGATVAQATQNETADFVSQSQDIPLTLSDAGDLLQQSEQEPIPLAVGGAIVAGFVFVAAVVLPYYLTTSAPPVIPIPSGLLPQTQPTSTATPGTGTQTQPAPTKTPVPYPNPGPTRNYMEYVADSNIFADRPSPRGRAVPDAYLANPNNVLFVPIAAVEELTRQGPGETVYQRIRLAGQSGGSTIVIVPFDAPGYLALSQADIARLTPGKFNEYDLRIVETAKAANRPLLTTNDKMPNQIRSNVDLAKELGMVDIMVI